MIGLVDYAATLGLPRPNVELAALDEELATVVLYPDTLGALRRVRATGVRVAVASNLALLYAAPRKALLGDLVLPSPKARSSLTGRSTSV